MTFIFPSIITFPTHMINAFAAFVSNIAEMIDTAELRINE